MQQSSHSPLTNFTSRAPRSPVVRSCTAIVYAYALCASLVCRLPTRERARRHVRAHTHTAHARAASRRRPHRTSAHDTHISHTLLSHHRHKHIHTTQQSTRTILPSPKTRHARERTRPASPSTARRGLHTHTHTSCALSTSWALSKGPTRLTIRLHPTLAGQRRWMYNTVILVHDPRIRSTAGARAHGRTGARAHAHAPSALSAASVACLRPRPSSTSIVHAAVGF